MDSLPCSELKLHECLKGSMDYQEISIVYPSLERNFDSITALFDGPTTPNIIDDLLMWRYMLDELVGLMNFMSSTFNILEEESLSSRIFFMQNR